VHTDHIGERVQGPTPLKFLLQFLEHQLAFVVNGPDIELVKVAAQVPLVNTFDQKACLFFLVKPTDYLRFI
jgi:hypothetical protein